jgi:LuxR family maltose regulon positive regulatory protein
MLAPDGVGRMGRDAAHGYELDADDGPWRAVACLLGGAAHHLRGERERAAAVLDEGAQRAARRAPAIEALCLAQLALLALEQADWEQGAALADRAAETIRETAFAGSPPSTLVHAAAAFARAHRGRIDEARQDVAAARRLLARDADYAPWYGAQTRIALARAELRLSNAAETRALLAEASRLLRRTPDATVLQTWIDDAWARADAFAAAAVRGPSTLTTAELRVLRFLPSHLSFREIAARLHVSANTVKTQAHAVYRKLDSSSRSEAVARARDIGLVDG